MTGFVSYFDGEKDPRNLMIVFSILRVPMTEWNIHRHAQELFDAVFNYFPITFRPPPNDPYGITAQDLKDRLRYCIASSAELAPYAFPALLDKLDSTSMNTKRDVIQTITSCVENYGPQTVSLYSVTLWDALKFEILQVQDEDLAQAALEALAGIAAQLSKNTEGALIAYLKPIAKEGNEHLEDAPTKQSQATERILEQVAAASHASCNFFIGAVFPTIFALYSNADAITKRRGLVEVLNGLLRADVKVFGEWKSIEGQPSVQAHNSLRDQHGQTLELLINGLSHTPQKEVSFRLATLSALTNLLKARSVLGSQDLSRTTSILADIVLNEEPYGNDDVKTASMSSLVEAAQQKPQLVIDNAFPQFLSKLPDTDPEGPSNYLFVLEAFAQTAKEGQVFPTVVVRLRNKLNAALHQNATPKFIQSILAALLYAFNQGTVSFRATQGSIPYYDDLVLPLITQAAAATETENLALRDEGVLELIGKLANVVIRPQTTEVQNSITPQLYTLFNSTDALVVQAQSPSSGKHLLILATYLLAAVNRDVALPRSVPEMLSLLKGNAQRDGLSPRIRLACVEQISLLVNKHIPAGELSQLVASEVRPQDLLHENHSIDIRIAFAVTKAVLLRNASFLPEILHTLLLALSLQNGGLTIAHGFASLLQPGEILCKENHCIISALHRQKLLNLVVSDISGSFPTADPVLKKNYLVALAGILQYLQYTIIEPQLSTLTPLVLQMLDLVGETNVKAAAIDTIIAVLTQQPKPLEEHTSSLIARLLACTTVASAPANVRARALQALSLVPSKLDRTKVIPFRRQVVRRLTEALDDKKRDVRNEAVKCRSRWIELDEAGDDDD